MGLPTTPLATADQLVKRYPQLTQSVDTEVLDELMMEATGEIETLTSRRLAPFSGHIYEAMLYGLDPNEYGDTQSNMPLDIYGAIGQSYANALGAGDLVRHAWLDHFAPHYPDLWTYNITAMNIHLTYGNFQPIQVGNGGIYGPEVTNGHIWFRLGTFIPTGTRLQVVYDGGYTGGIPPALRRACLFQAAKFLIVDAEPVVHGGLSTDMLDSQIMKSIAPWMRA